jgi:type II secretory pathway pseudopilin PulG
MVGRKQHEAGETLVEILVSILVIATVFAAFAYAYVTGFTATKTHRDYVVADNVLRTAAEQLESAVRDACATGTTYSVTFTAPPGFTPPSPISSTCPGVSPTPDPQMVPPLVVKLPNGQTKSLSVMVRQP